MVGAGGEFFFFFKAITVGSTKVRLIYHRSFEENVPEIDSFEINIIIQ
jgi:predicted secreted protein